MKGFVVALCALALFCSFALTNAAEGTIWETLKNDSTHTKLVEAITNTNNSQLIDLLNSNTSLITLFAPIDSAIDQTTGVPVSFFDYHVAEGNLTTPENNQVQATLLRLATLNNNFQVVKFAVTNSSVTINGDSLVVKTQQASNGVIHSINRNLTAPGSVGNLVNGADFSLLKAALEKAELTVNQASITLFAPVDAAFKALPEYILNYLLSSQGAKNQLPKILLGHLAINNTFYLWGKTGSNTVTTAEGAVLTVNVTAANTTVNNALVTSADNLVASGVVQVINQVLVPADVKFSIIDVLIGLKQDDLVANLNKTANALYEKLAATTGAFTVFAAQPFADDATLLEYHVVDGVFNAADLKNGQLLTTEYVRPAALNGLGQKLKVTITDGKVYINGVEVVTPDNKAANGVVHILKNQIASVPKPIDDLLTGSLSILGTAISFANLKSTFAAQDGNFTVFAPTDDAFKALPPATAGFLLLNTNDSNAQLAKVLQYHVASTVVYSADIKPPQELTMLDGQKVQITGNGTIMVNNAKVLSVDNLASNGVAHVIDAVLIPTGLDISFQNLLDGAKATEFIKYLNKTGLLKMLASSDNFTIFAPTNEAFDKVKDKSGLEKSKNDTLFKLLAKHIIPNLTLTTLTNATYTALDGSKIKVYSTIKKTRADEVVYMVNVDKAKTPAGQIEPGSSTVGTKSAYIYPIDQVLGQADKPKDDDSGLTSTEVGLIVAGCIVAVLLAGAAIGGGVWYYKRRHGYEQIDADTTF